MQRVVAGRGIAQRVRMNLEPVTLRSLSDVALVAPFMLGYWPEHSVCVIVVDADGHVLLIMRWHVDAPDVPPQLPLAEDARATAFHVVVYSDDPVARAEASARIAADLSDRGIPRGRVLLAERQGPDIVVRVSGEPGVAAEGLVISEMEIAETGGRWDLDAWAMSREEYVGDIISDPVLVDEVAAVLAGAPALDESARDEVIGRIGELLIQGRMSPADIAAVLVGLGDTRVRDTVLWDLMHSGVDTWSEAADSLAEVVAGSPDEYVAAPATILGILRWQQGDGSRAAAAVERALEADPSYSLADLINRSLLVGLHPGVWAEGLVGLTREACRRAA